MSNPPQAFIVGTAGHIDHGKTSLVRALTGVDLDRNPEERRRGITISLGFTGHALPSGRIASFVDVPGHERLVRTMIAGASGIDAVILCVSAAEGVMPQTREHLAILRLLGVKRGLVALTMADLVDEEMLELAADDVHDAIAGTFLEDAPLIVTSAVSRRGLEELTAALDALPFERRPSDGPFRLPVDRSFIQRGFGTVVTGTVASGAVRDGDELRVLPEDLPVRVRGLQVHGEKCEGSQAGLRTALNLAGVEREELPRGTVIASPHGVPVTSILDIRYHHLPDAPTIASGSRVRLLLGTAEVMAIADGLGLDLEPGSSQLVQLRTSEPVCALPGDRLVLRRESPIITLGGGEVLDPWASRIRTRQHDRERDRLERLEAGDALVFLERAGPGGLSAQEARARLGSAIEQATALGDRVLDPSMVQAHREALLAALDQFHADNPLLPGPARRALHRGALAALSQVAFDALLQDLSAQDALRLVGPRAARVDFEIALDPGQRAAHDAMLAQLDALALVAATPAELLEPAGADGEALLAILQDAGTIEKVGGRVYLRAHLDRLKDSVRAVLEAEGELSTGRFKDLTGLTRRNAIPLLEWLDRARITMRQGDTRVPWST